MEKNYCKEHRRVITHVRKMELSEGYSVVCFSECLRCEEITLKIITKKNV